MPKDLVGAVLAGGKSSRLGQDKTMLVFNKISLLERSINLLYEVVTEVYVLGKDPALCRANADGWFQDEIKGIGPIGGIFTGLKNIGKPLLVISCDLPFLDKITLQELIDGRKQKKETEVMTTFFHPKTNFIESLVAIYENESLKYIEKAIAKKIFKLSRAIPEHVRNHILWEKDLKVFFNINYPQDLEVLGIYDA
ncbi:molybdenum cofactor guanylyltransferase [Desulfonauticus submarinus]